MDDKKEDEDRRKKKDNLKHRIGSFYILIFDNYHLNLSLLIVQVLCFFLPQRILLDGVQTWGHLQA